MELLDAGRLGTLRGNEVPEALRPVLIEAALRLMALSADAPRAADDPWLNLVVTETRSYDGAETHSALLETSGTVGTRLPWQQGFGTALAMLAEALDDALEADASGLASSLKDILLRLNLQWYAVDALRSDDAVLAFASVIAKIGAPAWEYALREGFPPVYLIARGACVHELTHPETPATAAAWREAAYRLWDRGDGAAQRARGATGYSALVVASLEALLWYEASVHLFLHYALPAEKRETRREPDELIKDWGVVEEFRVGALEVVRSFGHNLLWRPAHFLRGSVSQSLGEATRRALLAARGQISVYPDAAAPLWQVAADALGREIIVTDENCFELSFRLEAQVASRLNSAFDDPEVTAVAARLRGAKRLRERLYLRSDWPRYVFWDRAPVILDAPELPPEGASKSFTTTTRSAHEHAYLKTILGLPSWPFTPATQAEV